VAYPVDAADGQTPQTVLTATDIAPAIHNPPSNMCLLYECMCDTVSSMDATTVLDPAGVALLAALDGFQGVVASASSVRAEVDSLLAEWADVDVPLSLLGSVGPEEARVLMAGADRLRRRLDAALVVLSGVLGAGRDTVAAMTRTTGMSNSAAKQYVRVARQAEVVPEIVEQLGEGALSLEHAIVLSSTDADTARSLVAHATLDRVDEFRCRVKRAEVDRAGAGRRERQRAERSVRFSSTPEGSVRATIVLPETEGTEFRNTLDQLCDAAYRKQFPERAATLGGHDAGPREQRLADAFVEWMQGNVGGTGRPAVVVVVDAETLDCTRLPNDAVSRSETAELIGRAHLYGLIRDHTTGETLRFGRNRRFATALQKLLLGVMHGYCTVDGCYEPACGADTDHIIPFARGGLTDIEQMQPLCRLHHADKTEHEHHPSHDQQQREGPCPAGPRHHQHAYYN
jgi:hypothetical protein